MRAIAAEGGFVDILINVGWGLSPVEVNDKPIIHKLIHSLVILGLLFGIMMFIRIIVGATFYRLFRNISMSTINKLDFLITLPARYSKADIENKAMVKWTSKKRSPKMTRL
jgi:hypothetical protein